MKLKIRKKFFLSYLLLFVCAALIIHQFMKISLEANSQAQIEAEMTKLQHTTREHIKQFSKLKESNDHLFADYGIDIARDLSRLQNLGVALYGTDGRFLYEELPIEQTRLLENQQFQKNLGSSDAPELSAAFDNKSALSLQKNDHGIFVYFAYPLYIDEEFYGVVRFTGDYTALFQQNDRILQSFSLFAVCLLIGIFIISFLLTSQIIRPLIRLSKATKRVAQGDYEDEVIVKTGDELEELADNFNRMKKSVKDHIDMAEEEKEKVLHLEKNRTAFFQHVTHELKTPLSSISGYAQILGQPDFDDPAFLQKAARKITEESERLNRMVVELIGIAKKQAAAGLEEHHPLPILPLIKDVCEDLEMQAEEREVSISISGSDWMVCGSRDQVQQVLINLLDNAIKHGTRGGVINVESEKGVITVKNPSSPLSDYMLEHAFEPFIYTKKNGNHGLGLYICREIVTAHNGTVSIGYENGETILVVRLPPWQQDGNI